MPGSFFDSNVILYIISDDEPKARRAEDLIENGGTISVQVLNEVVNVARRKRRMEWPALHTFLATLHRLFRIVPVTVDVHRQGLEIAERYHLATYDAMLVAAALVSGCDILWTEDMHHGLRIFDRLLVSNPFCEL